MEAISKHPEDTARASAIRESALDHVRLFSLRSKISTYIGLEPSPKGHVAEFRSVVQGHKDWLRKRKPPKFPARFTRWWSDKTTWRFGLYAGLCASIAVLLSNISLLLVGLLTHHDTQGGMSTIAKGEMKQITTISTAYHALINILSTILLTSSNYAMQILCAPTRQEIERAHAHGQWMEIGIMSLRNLRHIDRRRIVLWALLAVSSAPLHLFYNSSIFEAFAAQDHEVNIRGGHYFKTLTENPTWKTLENKEWSQLYTSSWVPGYGDLYLFVDRVSYQVQVTTDWQYSLHAPDPQANDCGWPAVWFGNESFNIAAKLTPNLTTMDPIIQTSRYVVPRDDYAVDTTGRYPTLEWPGPYKIQANSSDSLLSHLQICPDTGWLSSASAFHVQFGRAKKNPYANRVQIAIPFLSLVIASNLIKIACIFSAIKMLSPGHIITVGDAVATFLNQPDISTRGKCIQSKAQLCAPEKELSTTPWRQIQRPNFTVLGGKRVWSMAIILIALSLSIAALAVATGPGRDMSTWGTSSKTIVSFTSMKFDSGGVLLVAFLANLPQVMLSLLYFSINRICTSACFATEWNNYGVHRKGLRVTSPAGKQRSTHFLQLPFRWAIPLTVMSGLLHWLLSQSLFLVRQEVRTREGELYPGSTCACGYSAQSLLAFTLVFIALLIAVLYWLLRGMDIHIPPARHCSLVISAACHPPEGDVDAHLAEVKWGVTVVGTEEYFGHCTFTSGPVESVQPGALYE